MRTHSRIPCPRPNAAAFVPAMHLDRGLGFAGERSKGRDSQAARAKGQADCLSVEGILIPTV